MTAAFRAGIGAFAVVFAIGFVLGTGRVLLLAPRLGALAATLIELPMMLVASWVTVGWAVARWRVPPRAGARLTMGATAFVLLIAAEIALGVVGFGRTLSEQATAMAGAAGALGLAAQIAFASFPLARR